MENRVKEQQLDLYADRTSCTRMRSNQLGLSLSAVAYEGVDALSRLGLRGTALAKATVGAPSTQRLKIGAQVRVSVRSWVNRGKKVSSRLRSIHPPVLPPPPMR